MGAVTMLCATSPVNTFFHWVGNNAPCSGPASQAFRRTIVHKLDEQGETIRYRRDPVSREVSRVRGPVVENDGSYTDLHFIEDIETGELYFDEPRHILAGKCIDIMLATPLYLLVDEIWNVTKTAALVSLLAIDLIVQSCEQLWRGDFAALGSILGNRISDIVVATVEGVWGIVSGPLYAIGLECAALYGIVDQYRGRKWVAAIEHSWQKGVSYRADKVYHPNRRTTATTATTIRSNEPFLASCIRDIQKARTFYLANCFQVRGNTHDRNIRVLRTETL